MEFSDELIKVLDYLGDKIGLAIDWSSQNVMSYLETLAEKFINWEIGTNMFWIVLGIAIIILGIVFDYLMDSCGMLSFIGVIIGVIVIATNTYDLIKVYTFPELRLYEYVTSLLKKGV